MTEIGLSSIAAVLYDMVVLEIDQGNASRAVQFLEQARALQAASLAAYHSHLARTQALSGETYLLDGSPRGRELVESALANMNHGFADDSPSIKRGRHVLQNSRLIKHVITIVSGARIQALRTHDLEQQVIRVGF